MKKIAPACLLLLIGTAVTLARTQDSANAGPFTGRWVVHADNGDGTFRETVFALDQRASALTGRVINPTNEQPIVDGTAMGDNATFAVVTGRPPNERRAEYRAYATDVDAHGVALLRIDR